MARGKDYKIKLNDKENDQSKICRDYHALGSVAEHYRMLMKQDYKQIKKEENNENKTRD